MSDHYIKNAKELQDFTAGVSERARLELLPSMTHRCVKICKPDMADTFLSTAEESCVETCFKKSFAMVEEMEKEVPYLVRNSN